MPSSIASADFIKAAVSGSWVCGQPVAQQHREAGQCRGRCPFQELPGQERIRLRQQAGVAEALRIVRHQAVVVDGLILRPGIAVGAIAGEDGIRVPRRRCRRAARRPWCRVAPAADPAPSLRGGYGMRQIWTWARCYACCPGTATARMDRACLSFVRIGRRQIRRWRATAFRPASETGITRARPIEGPPGMPPASEPQPLHPFLRPLWRRIALDRPVSRLGGLRDGVRR